MTIKTAIFYTHTRVIVELFIDLETDTFSTSQTLKQQNKNLTHSVNKIY